MKAGDSRVLRKIFLLIAAVLLCSVTRGDVIYVDAAAAGANNGTSWTDAHTFLQEALAYAHLAEKPVEIRVAQGTYGICTGTGEPIGRERLDAIPYAAYSIEHQRRIEAGEVEAEE